MLVTALLVGLVGALTGYAALKRRGLFLGLTTLAVGLVVYRFVFENPYFLSQVQVHRPTLFGLSLDGDRPFYFFALGSLGLVLLVVDRMRRGRLGRVLAAMRDSETGARSIGLDLRAYKLTVFSASAAIAAFGGALVSQSERGFTPLHFDPFHSLFWFTAVIVAGASFVSGSVVAAVLFVVLDLVLGDGGSILVIGVLALFMSRFPGGIVGTVMSVVHGERAPRRLGEAYMAAMAPAEPDYPEEPLQPSEFAQRVLSEVSK
jgi:branched-chain amino acid transport system permease protein